jgi:ABC-2 type transport system permease protein
VTALPNAISGSIASGVFEALLATPTSTAGLLMGLASFDVLIAVIRAAVLLSVAGFLGAELIPSQLPLGGAVLGLIVLAHVPFGLMGAAMVLAFRTAGPLPRAIVVVSTLMGGVYYPTNVIPSWLQHASGWLPLTYGLRALRRVLLQHATLDVVAAELWALIANAFVLFVVGAVALSAAMRYARREGTLAQY